MNNFPTFRRGRKVYRENGEGGVVRTVINLILIIIALFVPIPIMIWCERSYYRKMMTLRLILENGVQPLTLDSRSGETIHISGAKIIDETAQCIDYDFNVIVKGSFNMKRQTEYCQWSESSTESCQKCTREVKAKDGSTSTESYKCHCVTQYYYTKGWQPYLISSVMFDQPAAHHNPSRNPYPSRSFTSNEGALLSHSEGDIKVQLPRDLVQNTRASYRKIDWVPGGLPPPRHSSYFSNLFFGADRTRYEPVADLRQIAADISYAAVNHNFVYVGQGGYFFSPYQSSKAETLLKYFLQYTEGTLFDWQLGDLIQSCTPGDIRVSYKVQDPIIVSVVAGVGNNDHQRGLIDLSSINVGSTFNNVSDNLTMLGFVHEGEKSADEIIKTEQNESFFQVALARGLFLIWAIPVSAVVGVLLGKDIHNTSLMTKFFSIFSIWCFGLASIWIWYWGSPVKRVNVKSKSDIYDENQMTTIFFALFVVFGSIALRYSKRRKGLKNSLRSRLNTLWCTIARWAGAPPHWREEESYGEFKEYTSDYREEQPSNNFKEESSNCSKKTK